MIDDALIRRVRDEEIRDGLRAAIDKNILPVMLEKAYPGHFAITAQQESFGRDCTWPGLDSWQLAGAYLLLGQTRLVLDYFDFVEASQRADGNIPFAVFPEEDVRAPEKRATHLRGMRYPEDIFTYAPGRGYPERPDRQGHRLAAGRLCAGAGGREAGAHGGGQPEGLRHPRSL